MADPLRRKARDRLVPAPQEDLCLEFANTRSWRGSQPPTEKFRSFADILAWCAAAKSLDRASATELRAWGNRRTSDAVTLFDEVVATRETIYRLFSATAAGGTIAGADAATLNRLLERAPGRTILTVGDAANLWRLPPATPTAASVLAPVLWSTGDLLAGGRLAKVRSCANEKCLWLFLDDSKGGTRRWCSMSACGNRAKAHRHYMRKANLARDMAS